MLVAILTERSECIHFDCLHIFEWVRPIDHFCLNNNTQSHTHTSNHMTVITFAANNQSVLDFKFSIHFFPCVTAIDYTIVFVLNVSVNLTALSFYFIPKFICIQNSKFIVRNENVHSTDGVNICHPIEQANLLLWNFTVWIVIEFVCCRTSNKNCVGPISISRMYCRNKDEIRFLLNNVSCFKDINLTEFSQFRF